MHEALKGEITRERTVRSKLDQTRSIQKEPAKRKRIGRCKGTRCITHRAKFRACVCNSRVCDTSLLERRIEYSECGVSIQHVRKP